MLSSILLIVHVFVSIALIGVIMLQRSEGGIGLGGGGGPGNFMSVRGASNLLTRITAILAGLFFAISLGLGALAAHGTKPHSILDSIPASGVAKTSEQHDTAPSVPVSGAPVEPKADAAPEKTVPAVPSNVAPAGEPTAAH
ncbi:MAG: preprotein translocase subunit SecG [Alphaproteobacteria bacterium]